MLTSITEQWAAAGEFTPAVAAQDTLCINPAADWQSGIFPDVLKISDLDWTWEGADFHYVHDDPTTVGVDETAIIRTGATFNGAYTKSADVVVNAKPVYFCAISEKFVAALWWDQAGRWFIDHASNVGSTNVQVTLEDPDGKPPNEIADQTWSDSNTDMIDTNAVIEAVATSEVVRTGITSAQCTALDETYKFYGAVQEAPSSCEYPIEAGSGMKVRVTGTPETPGEYDLFVYAQDIIPPPGTKGPPALVNLEPFRLKFVECTAERTCHGGGVCRDTSTVPSKIQGFPIEQGSQNPDLTWNPINDPYDGVTIKNDAGVPIGIAHGLVTTRLLSLLLTARPCCSLYFVDIRDSFACSIPTPNSDAAQV